jgi:hypothetical protein
LCNSKNSQLCFLSQNQTHGARMSVYEANSKTAKFVAQTKKHGARTSLYEASGNRAAATLPGVD